jgi:BASS family bile acid:Na+ symporter
MSRLLAFLGGHATWVLFVGVFLGLALPALSTLARPLLAPAVAVLLTATLVRIDWHVMLGHLRRPWTAAVIIAWLLIGAPLATAGVLALLPLPIPLTTALVLMAAAPPILSAAPIAMMLGLDGALALVVGLIATLLTPPPPVLGVPGVPSPLDAPAPPPPCPPLAPKPLLPAPPPPPA